jgi:hypothetical protein
MYKKIKVWPYGFEVKLKVEPKGHMMKFWRKSRVKLFPLLKFVSFVLIMLFFKKEFV